MKRNLWIRPVYVGEKLVSYALTTTNGTILVDGQILDHFGLDYSGKEIKAAGVEFYDGQEVEWGKPINNK